MLRERQTLTFRTRDRSSDEGTWAREPLLKRADDVSQLPYMVGGLMYVPALNEGIADRITGAVSPRLDSICLCLEDSIRDEALPEAERALARTLRRLETERTVLDKLPLIFVRVRTPEHFRHVRLMLGDLENILTGYVLPKFDCSNAARYLEVLEGGCSSSRKRVFAMPILESAEIGDPLRRPERLTALRRITDAARENILNIRIGGNDLCNLYGVRRTVHQTIYDIRSVSSALADIASIFSKDYVVSGAVWEYYGQDREGDWAQGLRREIELDLVNGFVGKTAIHPTQIPVIREASRVPRKDLEDALRILNWSAEGLGVAASSDRGRMNEVKCHTAWAKKVYAMARVYGTRGEKG